MITLEELRQERDRAMREHPWDSHPVRFWIQQVELEEYRLFVRDDPWHRRMSQGGPAGGCDAEYE